MGKRISHIGTRTLCRRRAVRSIRILQLFRAGSCAGRAFVPLPRSRKSNSPGSFGSSSVFADRDDLASRLPVLDDRHVCQKHPIAPASSDHGINLVRQETRCDVSVAQLAASLQEDPGDGDGLFQQLRLAHRTHSREIVSMHDTNRPQEEAKRLQLKPALRRRVPTSKIGRNGFDQVNLPGFARLRFLALNELGRRIPSDVVAVLNLRKMAHTAPL
jgi:hypothetical protein